MASANVETRAAEIFAAGAQARAEQADDLTRQYSGPMRDIMRATTLRYLEPLDRTFARQKAEREARQCLDARPADQRAAMDAAIWFSGAAA